MERSSAVFTNPRFSLLFSLAITAPLGAQTVSMVSGNGQMAFEQFDASQPLVLQAKDATGHAVSGLTVTWCTPDPSTGFCKIAQGSGTIKPFIMRPDGIFEYSASSSSVTDANGIASAKFLASGLSPGLSFESEKVTATTSFGSVSFFVTTVLSRTSSGGNAIPPSVLMDAPSLDNRNITAASGSTVLGAVVIRVFDQSGFQGGPVPNVGIRILNYPDQTLPPPPTCNAPQGVALTDSSGTATCDLVITGPPVQAALIALAR